MFLGAVMTLYSQQACATLHWRMRKTAGPAACRGPDSFLSSYGPITLLNADVQAAVKLLPVDPLVCCTQTVKQCNNVDSDAVRYFKSCLLRVEVILHLIMQI